ncbi:MAG: ATP-grasp domain-containing protein [Candidatus Omnitrophica bacterium]|nr:ATP-grasp domain-containing protein [Candidatus Omnitrophota bacterium]
MKTRVLITAVGAPPGFNALRALMPCEDIELFVSDANTYAPGLYRFPEIKSFIVPMALQENEYISALLKIVQEHRISVILPCLEDEILVLSKHLRAFREHGVSIPIPEFERLMLGVDKLLLNQIASDLGIPHPETFEIQNESDIKQLEKINFPAIIKPRISHGARGFCIVNDYSMLATKAVELREDYEEGIIVQELIPGQAGSILLCGLIFDHNHKLKVSFQSRSLKTMYPFGGPAIVGEPIQNPMILEWSKNIIEKIGMWRGPVNIEFMVNPKNNKPHVMDLNPRLWGYSSLPVFCGINFPYLCVQVALGNDIKECHDYEMGKVMIRSFDDFYVSKSELKKLIFQKE